jgi:hypothetical protein
MNALRDELGCNESPIRRPAKDSKTVLGCAFLFWLAAKLEKKHKDAVVRYSEKSWSHVGKGAVSTRKDGAS